MELEAAAAVQRTRAASKKNREGNVKFKTKGGQQSMEVLLDPKKHRNVSRRQVCDTHLLNPSPHELMQDTLLCDQTKTTFSVSRKIQHRGKSELCLHLKTFLSFAPLPSLTPQAVPILVIGNVRSPPTKISALLRRHSKLAAMQVQVLNPLAWGYPRATVSRVVLQKKMNMMDLLAEEEEIDRDAL